MIAPQPFFENRGTPISVLGRLSALSDLGHMVDLITYPVGEKVEIPGVHIYRCLAVPFIKEVPIGPSWKKALLDINLLIKAFKMLRKKKYHLLHTHEEAGFFSIILKRMFRVPHIYDMHSSLPQQLSNFKYFRHPLLVRIFLLMELKVLRSSNAVITICPALCDYVKKIDASIPQVMIENVPVEKDPINPETPDDFDRNLLNQWQGKKIFLYTGNFQSYQGIELLIKSARLVVAQHRDVLFLLVGGEPEHIKFYQAFVNTSGMASNFHFTGKRPYAEIPFFIKHCDFLISPRIHGTNTPLKIYSYLKSGKPIIATNLYTHTQVLNHKISVLVAPEETAMAKGIVDILSDPERAKTLGDQAQKWFHSYYSYSQFIHKTKKIYEMALKKGIYEKKTPATDG